MRMNTHVDTCTHEYVELVAKTEYMEDRESAIVKVQLRSCSDPSSFEE